VCRRELPGLQQETVVALITEAKVAREVEKNFFRKKFSIKKIFRGGGRVWTILDPSLATPLADKISLKNTN